MRETRVFYRGRAKNLMNFLNRAAALEKKTDNVQHYGYENRQGGGPDIGTAIIGAKQTTKSKC